MFGVLIILIGVCVGAWFGSWVAEELSWKYRAPMRIGKRPKSMPPKTEKQENT